MPTYANGKICYIEIPALEVAWSAEFYSQVFGWELRKRGDGQTAFTDTAGEVSGTWVTGRKPADDPGLVIYIMVDDISTTLSLVTSRGGTIVQPVDADSREITAKFLDPAGNVIGLYQERR